MSLSRTKIVCTIGPASRSKQTLKELALAGMSVARLNFSHGSHEEHEAMVHSLRDLSRKLKRPLAILQDLQGPKIRTGRIKDGGTLLLKPRETVTITTRDIPGEPGIISSSYKGITRDVSVGDTILMDDGLIELKVVSKDRSNVQCRVISGGILGERKGINLPGVTTRIPSLTPKDREDLELGIRLGVDYVALSFVRSARDIQQLRGFLKKASAPIPIIAKIEKPQALEDLEAILDQSDGIMVARGDLGVELSPEKVPTAQKQMIRMANQKRKLVITATQMLESMTRNPIPTRAEASDVANAILDGTDAVMLSGETSMGQYPVQSVRMMSRIAQEAERHFPASTMPIYQATHFPEAIAEGACMAAVNLRLKAIAAFSRSGFTARLISKYRPPVPIIAFTPYEATERQLSLYWGVHPLRTPHVESTDHLIQALEEQLIQNRLARKGDRIAILGGIPLEARGKTNMMKLHVVGEA